MGRKSNAVLAKEAAAKAAAEQVVETPVVEETVETPEVVEAPVVASVDPVGEDLGDVTDETVETPVDPTEAVIEGAEPEEVEPVAEPEDTAPELVEEFSQPVESTATTEVTELPDGFEYELEDGFAPILRPTMVGEELTGHIPCPKGVFDLVQTEGWQSLIDSHVAKAGLKSVLFWKRKNGSAVVRCMSSSRFADVV
ncbi:hypothetical protein D3C76_363200 [compost metagenome]